eukprot:12881724-Alexandrium_andersonii.AAC.1
MERQRMLCHATWVHQWTALSTAFHRCAGCTHVPSEEPDETAPEQVWTTSECLGMLITSSRASKGHGLGNWKKDSEN